MGSSKKQTVGYRYFIGMHMAICHGPVDNVLRVKVGDKIAWPTNNDSWENPLTYQDQVNMLSPEAQAALAGRPPGSPIPPATVVEGQVTTSSRIYINNPGLFGGESKEGGVQGFVDFAFGKPDQLPNDYLQAQFGTSDIPAFRGVLCAIIRKCFVASGNPYIKSWSYYVRRVMAQYDGSPQWEPSLAEIGEFDMNPAHMIRECLTNKVWGKGHTAADIDQDSFFDAAWELKTENFGLSAIWGDTRTIEEFVQDIVATINGNLFQERDTNKWKLTLVRPLNLDPEDPEDVPPPSFDGSNIVEMQELRKPFYPELVNQVTLTFWNRETGKDEPLTVDNSAVQDIAGRVEPMDVNRTMIANFDLAARVAARELHAASTPLWSGRMVVNRDGMALELGAPFYLNWTRPTIEGLLCRVTAIDFGTLTDGKITVSFVEDAYARNIPAISSKGDSLWQSPINSPLPLLAQKATEIPFWTMINEVLPGSNMEASYYDTVGFLAVAGVRADSMTSKFSPWQQIPPEEYVDSVAIMPPACGCQVVNDVPWAEFTYDLPITNIRDAALAVYLGYAYWDDEIVQVLDFNASAQTISLARGVLDTSPQEHAAGSWIILAEGRQFLEENIGHLPGTTINVKVITENSSGFLRLADAPTSTVTFKGRHFLPYPPGKLRFNGALPFTDFYLGDGDIAITYATRERWQQLSSIVHQDAGDISGDGDEARYVFRVRDMGTDTVLREIDPVILVLGLTYTEADLIADSESLDPPAQDLQIELWAAKNSLFSWMPLKKRVSRQGLGFRLGEGLGGEH